MLDDLGWLGSFLVSPWFGVAAGLLLQVFGVQRVKFWLPVGWSDFRRKRVIEVLGLAFGYVPTMFILQAQGCPSYQVVWLPLLVAVAGPVGWKVVVAFLYRAHPELEGRLSAHGRARRMRNGVRS